tara:strand:- start:324 stop:512 length:189 start_codon:yes stop_codon:yes gene_type:complete
MRVIGVQSLLPMSITDLDGKECFPALFCFGSLEANGLTVICFWSDAVTPSSFSFFIAGESGE